MTFGTFLAATPEELGVLRGKDQAEWCSARHVAATATRRAQQALLGLALSKLLILANWRR